MGLLLRVVSAPVWFLAIALFASSFIWLRLCMVFASAVHFVLDVATGGALARNLEEWMVPAGGTPKGFAASLAKRFLNDPETYTYFAPIVYSSCNFTAMWASVLWWRLGDPASTFPVLANSGVATWVPALLAHMYVMGCCFPNGANELHYAAHLQVSTRPEGRLFKSNAINQFLRFALEPAMGWIPGFWLDHHVLIHHKESNGADDIQSVSFFERCFVNFGWFIAEMPLQWYVRAPLHHARRGDVTRAASMALTSVLYLALGVGLWTKDPLTASLLIFIPHVIRLFGFNAMNEYTQHTLVDNRTGKPEDPANNSFLLLHESPTSLFPRGLRKKGENWEERWHAVHHNFPRKHMSQQGKECAKIQCNLVFDTDYATFRKAAILKDVKVLADAWRPGYKFTEPPPLSPATGKPDTRALESGPDAALDQAGREAVIESFFAPAFSESECGDWVRAPSWPFSVMAKPPKKAPAASA